MIQPYEHDPAATRHDAANREDVSFQSAGEKCAAWLYRPRGPGPHPIVVMAHGIGAIRQVRLPAYAERFAANGIAVLCFDYRHWGESEGRPRYVADIAEQQRDIHHAIEFAKSLSGIDDRRIALWGTSFGGGHAVAVAARRRDLAAVVAQCAIVDCLAASLAAPPAQIVRWLSAAANDLVHELLGMDPVYVPLASEPGTNGVMTKLNAEAQYRALLMEPSRWENKLAARIFTTLPLYRPIATAAQIAAPLLMIVTDNDESCPGALQAAVAKRAPAGETLHYPASHFEIYFGALFERASADTIAFLTRHLGLNPPREPAVTRSA